MDLLVSLLTLIGLLFTVVIYQSRKDKPNLKLYFSRFGKLIVIILDYLRDIGLYSAQRFKEINWDLTYTEHAINQDHNL